MPKKMEISNDVRDTMGGINQDIVDFDNTGKDMPIKIDDSELNRAGVKNGYDYIIPVTDDSPGFKTPEERDEINKRWDYLEKNFSNTNSMKKYDELKDKAQVINNNIRTEYETTPSFFRGTTKEELDSYQKTGKIGGDKNGYNYVAVSSNPELSRTFANGVIIEYDGDSIRSKGTLVEYIARPQASGTSKGVIHSEEIGSPMSLRYSPEREVRLPEGVKVKDIGIKNIHLLAPNTQLKAVMVVKSIGIKNIHLRPPINDAGRQGLIDKYSKLGNVIFHENSWEFKKVLK